MVAQRGERAARLHQPLHEGDDAGAVGAAVAQVADEDQAAAVGMAAAGVVAQVLQQRAQGVQLAMDVAHHVERAFWQRGEHGRPGHGASFADDGKTLPFLGPRRGHCTTGSTYLFGSLRIRSINASTSTGFTKW